MQIPAMVFLDCVRTTSKQALVSIIILEILVVVFFLHAKSKPFVGTPVDFAARSVPGLDDNELAVRRTEGVSLHKNKHHRERWQPRESTGMLTNSPRVDAAKNLTTVAIGCAITSNKIKSLSDTTLDNIKQKFIFFSALLPTFCLTASPEYSYHFYMAYDKDDPFFSKYSSLVIFQRAFSKMALERCTNVTALSLHFVQCNHNKKPAWAQNDAMIEAYIDNVDYYYRINDDTLMSTLNWTRVFIEVLNSYNPPNVGVVGPTHRGGNPKILTYDFVHRSHIDLFGFYYPRVFTDWYGDAWMTNVYKPGRSTKLSSVVLRHTMKFGQRYGQHSNTRFQLPTELKRDFLALEWYVNWTRTKSDESTAVRRVISVSLAGKNPQSTIGAIRNAQLVKMYYPGWTYRIYIEKPSSEGNRDRSNQVPERIVNKLVSLGADIVYLDHDFTQTVPVPFWKYLVVDSDVDAFLVRDVVQRVGEREALGVADWLEGISLAPFYCMRDHRDHANEPITDSLWGGRPSKIRKLLPGDMEEAILSFVSTANIDLVPVAVFMEGQNNDIDSPEKYLLTVENFLKEVIHPVLEGNIFCHDSASCQKWPNSKPFPVERYDQFDFVGRIVDAFDTLPDSVDPPLPNVTTIDECQSPDSKTNKTTKLQPPPFNLENI